MWLNIIYNDNMEMLAIIEFFNSLSVLILYLKSKSPPHRQLYVIKLKEMNASHLLVVK
jgi:hypothetical protein